MRPRLPLSCSKDVGRAIYEAEARQGVGGTGTAPALGIFSRVLFAAAMGFSNSTPLKPLTLVRTGCALEDKTAQYCEVLQALLHPPKIDSHWSAASG